MRVGVVGVHIEPLNDGNGTVRSRSDHGFGMQSLIENDQLIQVEYKHVIDHDPGGQDNWTNDVEHDTLPNADDWNAGDVTIENAGWYDSDDMESDKGWNTRRSVDIRGQSGDRYRVRAYTLVKVQGTTTIRSEAEDICTVP